MQFLDVVRDIVRHMMGAVARWADKRTAGRLTPNMVTIASLLAHLPIAALMMTHHVWWAAGLLIIFGLLDTLDGELARVQHRESALGSLLDSVSDRLKEVFLYTAAAYNIMSSGRPYLAVWAVAACGLAMCVSYVNARGEAIAKVTSNHKHLPNRSFRTGIASFEIRMVILLLGLLTNRLALAMVAITLTAALTVFQRLANVARTLKN